MTNGKTPLYLTIAMVILILGWVEAVQPYSVPSRWARFEKPAVAYLRAALQQDSVALVRQATNPGPVTWALHAARAHPKALAVWSRYGRLSWGFDQGDTAIVYLETSTRVCSDDPIVLRFITVKQGARVDRASSACFDRP